MKITRSFIMANKTDRGAWTRSQIESLGIPWPPRKGWIGRAEGKYMSSENQRVFESKLSATASRRHIQTHKTANFEFEVRKKAALEEYQANKQLDLDSLNEARKFI